MFVCCAICIWWLFPMIGLILLTAISWLLRHAAIVFATVLSLCLAVAAFGELPSQSPVDQARADLGKLLFFDPRLSQDGTIACATCHRPDRGWSDGLPVAIGINGRVGTRNSPTIINAAYSPFMFHDGRAVGESLQALLPLGNPDEMAIRAPGVQPQNSATVVQRLRLIGGYVARFAQSFSVDIVEGSPITERTLGEAIAEFERTIVSDNAPIDRYLAGDKTALSYDARVGYRLAQKANCFLCHIPPLYTDNLFHNTGVEQATSLSDSTSDQGRFVVTRQVADRRRFKTPSLREVTRTAPYMHNGSYFDLNRVVRHYNFAGAYQWDRTLRSGQQITEITRDSQIDPVLKPQGWSEVQEHYVVQFLREAFSGTTPIVIEAPKEFPQ